MKIYLVRHGRASGAPGSEPALTPAGRSELEAAWTRLPALVPEIPVVFTSPLRRAVETAEILASVLRAGEPELLRELAPGEGPRDVLRALSAFAQLPAIALVGHLPGIVELCELLTTGISRGDSIRFPPGTIAAVDAERSSGSGALEWLLPPSAC